MYQPVMGELSHYINKLAEKYLFFDDLKVSSRRAYHLSSVEKFIITALT